jgi:hypothetical protein
LTLFTILTNKLKKTREKIAIRKARWLELIEKNNKGTIEETGQYIDKQMKVRKELIY